MQPTKSSEQTTLNLSRGQQLILLGHERWMKYCHERAGKAVKKSLTEFYAEAFDEELARANAA